MLLVYSHERLMECAYHIFCLSTLLTVNAFCLNNHLLATAAFEVSAKPNQHHHAVRSSSHLNPASSSLRSVIPAVVLDHRGKRSEAALPGPRVSTFALSASVDSEGESEDAAAMDLRLAWQLHMQVNSYSKRRVASKPPAP